MLRSTSNQVKKLSTYNSKQMIQRKQNELINTIQFWGGKISLSGLKAKCSIKSTDEVVSVLIGHLNALEKAASKQPDARMNYEHYEAIIREFGKFNNCSGNLKTIA